MGDTNESGLDRRNLLLAGAMLAASSVIAGGATSAVHAQASSLNPQPLPRRRRSGRARCHPDRTRP
jgi:hypothetical protein